MIIERTPEEIDELLDKATELDEQGGKYHFMTYELGVKEGIEWLLGRIETKPLEDE